MFDKITYDKLVRKYKLPGVYYTHDLDFTLFCRNGADDAISEFQKIWKQIQESLMRKFPKADTYELCRKISGYIPIGLILVELAKKLDMFFQNYEPNLKNHKVFDLSPFSMIVFAMTPNMASNPDFRQKLIDVARYRVIMHCQKKTESETSDLPYPFCVIMKVFQVTETPMKDLEDFIGLELKGVQAAGGKF
uniref:Uncharacterized protein n=1 Tax=Panagrolaimus sp. JU765 TaxID=591449 RepID=A0AC34R627_9BILA